MELEQQLAQFMRNIENAKSLENIEKEKANFLGRNGVLTQALKILSTLSNDERKSLGKKLNTIKNQAEEFVKKQVQIIRQQVLDRKLVDEAVDITLPVNQYFGSTHILSREIRRIKNEYQARGFLVLDGPEVETEFYNFDALNIPKYHPARQTQDTFYIEGYDNTLLRTQTSCVQIRAMQKLGLPLRMISIGKTYRNDQLDATHSPMFHQIEGLVVDYKPINISNLKYTLNRLISFIFEVDSVSLRFRPSFFPFTEPGMEVDCCYKINSGKIEITSNGDKWLELGGAGMVHPNVFQHCGVLNQAYGFAFGFGVERLVMLKYGITDIRLLYDTDQRWLEYYSSTRNN